MQMQICSQAVGAACEERDSKQDKREVGYSPRAEEAQSGVPTGNRSHKEKLTTAKTRLNVLEASLEELYQGQLTESLVDKVESLVDRLTEDTKDSMQHLHEVVAELTSKVTLLS
ncbi:hypothetical protein BHE74_00011881 [Ensete ventricosum]|nr:hypothetical protein GW17_00028283 [Ensete ventricosum]RWW79804.1 hypothetical protein BHE74_00011881 [Ensete ventricosum]